MRQEVREYTVVGARSAVGRSTIDIKCPFCGDVTTAYRWSLAGSGKRCEGIACGALFDGRGRAASFVSTSPDSGSES